MYHVTVRNIIRYIRQQTIITVVCIHL